jgi:hypothetical protein
MLRKMMIALAAITFVGAVVATRTADARGFGGGGFRRGGFRGGFGGGFRGAGVRSGFVGPGRFGFRPAFGLRFGFGPRFAFRNRVFFPQRRFAFAAVPLGVGLALQLRFLKVSESMGNHDSKIVDAGGVD